MNKPTVLAALLLAGVSTISSCSSDNATASKTAETGGTATAASAPAVKVEQTNMNNFHLVDFVGWNSNLTVLARYHADDVKVFGGDGFQTNGMPAHDAWLKKTLASSSVGKVTQHFPNVAAGEWTGVVGTIGEAMKIATVAKWKDGRISEEYLFMGLLKPADAAALQVPANAAASFANEDDPTLLQTVDLRPGWSCAMADVNGKRTAFFIKTVGGKEEQRMVFQ